MTLFFEILKFYYFILINSVSLYSSHFKKFLDYLGSACKYLYFQHRFRIKFFNRFSLEKKFSHHIQTNFPIFLSFSYLLLFANPAIRICSECSRPTFRNCFPFSFPFLLHCSIPLRKLFSWKFLINTNESFRSIVRFFVCYRFLDNIPTYNFYCSNYSISTTLLKSIILISTFTPLCIFDIRKKPRVLLQKSKFCLQKCLCIS